MLTTVLDLLGSAAICAAVSIAGFLAFGSPLAAASAGLAAFGTSCLVASAKATSEKGSGE